MKPSDSPVPTFGGDYRGKCPKEATEQVAFFNRVRQEYPETWGRIAIHIRNEDRMATARAMKLHKLEGLTVGASDIQIPGSPSLCIELKRLDPRLSTLSPEQAAYLVAAEKAGAFVAVCFGALAAWECFETWLDLQKTH